ncbi:MAG: glycoside hydrolase 43 family protein [Verrucomicrobiales bacterium]|nr:glycoside hydrolase 43 family protein [Verrucomicrobiales bacterium]
MKRLIPRLAVAAFLGAGCARAADDRFLRWGDQGDGTYANPILNGDFADSDVERTDDGWCMITSTNHLSPGMTILESKDLINWRYTAHAIPTLGWRPEYQWRQMNGYSWGVWAGDLAHRDGEWLCYQMDIRSGLYVTRAKELAGPWSEPVCLLEYQEGTDPAVYFDEERHEAWLVMNAGRVEPERRDSPNQLKLFRLSWEGDRLLDAGRVVFSGTGVEAAKLHRFDGRWCLMAIEWRGTGRERDRKQLFLRSTTDSIYGPYESRVVFERERVEDHSACQGSLIEAPDGRWWYLHQLVQNADPIFQGRPQCLQPVEWIDGWPMIGRDVDGDGIGEPVWRHEKPMPGAPALVMQTSDEFESQNLGPQWNWNHDPRVERFSLTERPGFLRLTASKPVMEVPRERMKAAFWGAPNTLSQRHLGIGTTCWEARLEVAGLRAGSRAGICHFSGPFRKDDGQYALLGVRGKPDGSRELFFEWPGEKGVLAPLESPQVFLRCATDFDRAVFSWSTDGDHWTEVPQVYKLCFGNWRGTRPGVFCWNDKTDDPQRAGFVDIDWIHYTPSPH